MRTSGYFIRNMTGECACTFFLKKKRKMPKCARCCFVCGVPDILRLGDSALLRGIRTTYRCRKYRGLFHP